MPQPQRALEDKVLDEIRDALSPLSLEVGKVVALIGHGRGEYSGPCPFHNDHGEQFTVSDRARTFHCFGCGAHGDVIAFIARTEGVEWGVAAERLAARLGISPPPEDDGSAPDA